MVYRKALIWLIPVLLFCQCKEVEEPPCGSSHLERPNVILIMVDDLGQECLETYGGESYSTPNINRLASQGLQFQNAYATYNCHTTRAQLMTGQYPFRNGWLRFYQDGKCFDSSGLNIGRIFKNAGYATGIFGKWQLCEPQVDPTNVLDCGFDESYMWTWKIDGQSTSRYWQPVLWEGADVVPSQNPDDYGPDMFLQRGKEFISSNCEKPFFLYWPMALVHSPFTTTPDQGVGTPGFDEEIAFPFMIEYMDKLVGELMDHLYESGLASNTVVIFTGDNGTDARITSFANGRLVPGGKNAMLETGVNVPFIIRWPFNIAPNTVTEELMDFTDILPTLAEIAGYQIPSTTQLQGVSFNDILTGGVSKREWIYSQYNSKWAIRDKRWKLTNENKLIDLIDDPYEENPISESQDNAESAGRRIMLQAYYEDLVD